MTNQLLVAGGGIGGLGAALAVARAGWSVSVLERAPAFSDIGAGIQLGPNSVKVLRGWGLTESLMACAAQPVYLRVRSAGSGRCLAELELGAAMASRYGAPYITLHRADLHAVLLQAASRQGDVALYPGQELQDFSQDAAQVTARTSQGLEMTGDVLIGADGLWSKVRSLLLKDGPPTATGHLAYRALVSQSALPEKLRTQDVTVWLGPRMHVVHYPVRGGEQLNLVAIVHGHLAGNAQDWDHAATVAGLQQAMQGCAGELRSRLDAVAPWRLWALHDRPPMSGAHQHAAGRVALLGDAAHPMRPYLAQGAGMALEDAGQLAEALGSGNDAAADSAVRLHRYAQLRWQRNARVQSRARRNGELFHSEGLLRWGRDASLRLLGGSLLDLPWLYGGGLTGAL